MSTRSEIKIIGEFASIKLYHHHDGYPEGVGFDLMNRFWKIRDDYQLWEFNEIANALVKDTKDEYEITEYNHTDREYEYEININEKTIRCWKVDWYNNEEGHWCAKRAEEVNLVKMWEKEEV